MLTNARRFLSLFAVNTFYQTTANTEIVNNKGVLWSGKQSFLDHY